MSTSTAKRRRKKKLSLPLGFKITDLTRALRAMRTAGVSISQIEIGNGKHHIVMTTNNRAPMIDTSSGWLAMREACSYGKFGRSRAYDLIAQGDLKVKKFGRKTLVSKASIDRLLRGLPRPARKRSSQGLP